MGILPACLHRVCTAREGQRWCWITLGLWLQTGDSYHVGAGDQEQSAFLARESLSRLQPRVSKFSETVESVGFSPAQSHLSAPFRTFPTPKRSRHSQCWHLLTSCVSLWIGPCCTFHINGTGIPRLGLWLLVPSPLLCEGEVGHSHPDCRKALPRPSCAPDQCQGSGRSCFSARVNRTCQAVVPSRTGTFDTA